MGRHSAADGASVDPVVAAALARRTAAVPGRRHGDEEPAGGEPAGERDTARLAMGPMTAEQSGSGLGWPAPPDREPSPGDLGWPGDMPEPARQRAGAEDPADAETPSRTRGWRRLFRAA